MLKDEEFEYGRRELDNVKERIFEERMKFEEREGCEPDTILMSYELYSKFNTHLMTVDILAWFHRIFDMKVIRIQEADIDGDFRIVKGLDPVRVDEVLQDD